MTLPIAPPRVHSSKGPNRVNRAHWPTKENSETYYYLMIFPVHGKMAWVGPKWGQEFVFLLIQTLPTCWAERTWILSLFLCFVFFWIPNFWISRSPEFQIPRFPGSQISRFPDFQTPQAAAPAPDELSDPNLTPLPTHSGIKYVARSPCCDLSFQIKELEACFDSSSCRDQAVLY